MAHKKYTCEGPFYNGKKSSFNTVTVDGAWVIEDSGDDNCISEDDEVVNHPSPSFLTPKNKEDNVDDDDADDNA